eukprot:2016321-Amphidinium_carterae.2
MTEVVVDAGASRTATQWGFGHVHVETSQSGPVLRSVDDPAIRQYGEGRMWAVVTSNTGQILAQLLCTQLSQMLTIMYCQWQTVTVGDVEVELGVPCIVAAFFAEEKWCVRAAYVCQMESRPDPPPGLAEPTAVAEVVRPTIHLGQRSINVALEVLVPDEADVRHHQGTKSIHVLSHHSATSHFTLGGGAAASRIHDAMQC